MLNRVILWSLENRLAILTLAALLFVFGVRTAMQAPLDVFPDFAPPQVVIQTEAPGMSAEEVEQLLTVPLETELNGTPSNAHLRRHRRHASVARRWGEVQVGEAGGGEMREDGRVGGRLPVRVRVAVHRVRVVQRRPEVVIDDHVAVR